MNIEYSNGGAKVLIILKFLKALKGNIEASNPGL